MLNDANADTVEAQRFWSSLYEAAYGDRDARITGANLAHMLTELERLFGHREHLAAVEMPHDLRGQSVLEVGSGAGAHSATFARRGARVTALDLTLERVLATARKFDLLDAADGFAVQGDASVLPFPDQAFDVVYSNGVLHHTPRIREAVAEVHRVLKPGGRAVVMLYARNSFLYRGVLFPVRGLLQGGIFRDGRWLGRATEWMADRPQTARNPWTEVFSARQVRRLFAGFHDVSVRKNGFTFNQIPVLGAVLNRLAGALTGYNDAGLLVYDRPWRNETRLELLLGRCCGWGLNVVAVK
jgi:SAM-dependent methyltransferase